MKHQRSHCPVDYEPGPALKTTELQKFVSIISLMFPVAERKAWSRLFLAPVGD